TNPTEYVSPEGAEYLGDSVVPADLGTKNGLVSGERTFGEPWQTPVRFDRFFAVCSAFSVQKDTVSYFLLQDISKC
ncbi:MAG: hypothetical protein LBP38_03100, partial [Desulfovibrio sp.]|nr:hypothetical protein [Desulfovibrio sp.]